MAETCNGENKNIKTLKNENRKVSTKRFEKICIFQESRNPQKCARLCVQLENVDFLYILGVRENTQFLISI